MAKQGIRATVYNRPRLATLLILTFIVWAPYIFFSLFYFLFNNELGSEVFGAPDRQVRENLYYLINPWQCMVGPLVVAVVASPLVSNDLRSNALYIYLAKPLRRIDYIWGKVGAIVVWTLPITYAPNLLLWASAVSSSNKSFQLREPAEILLEILLIQTVILVVLSLVGVMVSSLTKRWSVAMMAFLGGYFILWIVGGILQSATRDNEWSFLALPTNLINLARQVFERATPTSPDWGASLAIVLGVAAAAFGVFLVRILRLEVSE